MTWDPDGRRSRSRWPFGCALLVVVMAGCSGSGGGTSSPSGDAEGPAASPSASLQLASPKQPAGGAEETYTGVLGSDSIEGGCVYLQTADGQRYEIIPPDGWQLRKGPAELVAPDGSVVARAGDDITLRGHVADMVSICQIGPIVQVSEVVAGG